MHSNEVRLWPEPEWVEIFHIIFVIVLWANNREAFAFWGFFELESLKVNLFSKKLDDFMDTMFI